MPQFKNKYEFGADLKKRFPEYSDMDNYELADKVLAKYPQYKSLIPQEQGFFGRIGTAVGDNATLKEGSFLSNIGESAKERFGRAKENFIQGASTKGSETFVGSTKNFFNMMGNNIQNIGELAGFLSNDILGGAISGAVSTVLPDKWKAGIFETGKDLAGTKIGAKTLGFAGNIADKWGNFAQTNPETASTLAGIGNIAMAGLDAVSLGRASNLGQLAKQGVKTATAGTIKQTARAVDNVADFALSLKKTGKYTDDIISKISGMDKETINTIRSMPDIFQKAQEGIITRETLVEDFMKSFNSLDNQISNTGKLYEGVRKIQTPFSKKEIASVTKDAIQKSDIEILKGGKLSFAKSSINSKDSGAIKNALSQISDVVKGNKTLTVNEILNIRQKLDPLIAWNSELSQSGQKVVRDIRQSLRDLAHRKVPELQKLDSKFAPLKQQIKQVKKDFFNADGSLKDNAMSKLANITGKGKEKLLERLNRLDPEFQKKVMALKAFEDLERASGNKVGAYGKNIAPFIGAVLGGGPGYLLSETLTNPTLIAKGLKSYGRYLDRKTITQGVKQGQELLEQSVPSGKILKSKEKLIIGGQKPSFSQKLQNTAESISKNTNKSKRTTKQYIEDAILTAPLARHTKKK